MAINLILIIVFFFFMEFVAWFTHKYVMHGFLWVLHKDHHQEHDKKLERNDWFAVIFSVPSIILMIVGAKNGFTPAFYIGLGIGLYGVAYFLFHEVLVHQRLKMFSGPRSHYFKAIYKAHLDHHRKGNTNFGFLLFIPIQYFRRKYS